LGLEAEVGQPLLAMLAQFAAVVPWTHWPVGHLKGRLDGQPVFGSGQRAYMLPPAEGGTQRPVSKEAGEPQRTICWPLAGSIGQVLVAGHSSMVSRQEPSLQRC